MAVVRRRGVIGHVRGGHIEIAPPVLGQEMVLEHGHEPLGDRVGLPGQARPATALARLGAPVVTVLQRVAARRYLAAWAAAISRKDR